MWQPNAQIIQIEYGKDINPEIKVPGSEYIYIQLTNRLEALSHNFQIEALKNLKLKIPDFLWIYNQNLDPDQVILRIGLETYVMRLQNASDVFKPILDRCKFLSKSASTQSDIR